MLAVIRPSVELAGMTKVLLKLGVEVVVLAIRRWTGR